MDTYGGVNPPISCCLPKPGKCEFSEIVGDENLIEIYLILIMI